MVFRSQWNIRPINSTSPALAICWGWGLDRLYLHSEVAVPPPAKAFQDTHKIMKAKTFLKQFKHPLDELASLTELDDTNSPLEQKLIAHANGDSRCVRHGAEGIINCCRKVVCNLLEIETGRKIPSDWQRHQKVIESWEEQLDGYSPLIKIIDEHY